MKQILKLYPKLSVRGQWSGLLMSTFLCFLFTGFFKTVQSQTCAGNYTVEATRTYDIVANTTTFTYKVTQTGAKHALSNFSFPLECPDPNDPVDIAAALQGAVAETSYDGVNWEPSRTSYGKNPSAKSCYDGPVFKFDDGARSKVIWYRLTLNGSWELVPDFAILKYGQDCCVIDIQDGQCLTEACIPLQPGTLTGSIVCAPATGTITLSSSTPGAKYQLVNTNGTASTADDTNVQVAKDGNNAMLSWTGLAAGTYYVSIYRVPADKCSTVTNQATVTINPLPVISCSAMPTLIDITSAAHNTQLNVDLSGNSDTDPTHYTYAWTEDGAGSFNFNNIKNPVYTAGPLDAGQVISFTVTVTNKATGCSTTSNCSVTVNTAGSCPEVPTTAICSGSTNTYTAGRAPSTNETWKWTVNNGASITGADNGQSVTVKAGAQNFTLTLTISYANTELSPTVCTYEVIINPPTTATDPSDATRCVGGTSVVFSTTAGGTGPFTYQWSKDGSPIAGATMSSYTVAGPITAAQAGTYSVTVTGACGTDTESATLTVNLPTSSTQTQTICANLLPYTWDGLVFTEAGTKTKTGLTNAKGCDSTATFILIVNAVTTATDPSDATRCVGGTSVVFSTTAGGTGPFTYQWSKDGSPIAGATMSSYTVAGPITAAQAGTYSVTVTGACGTDTESATLTVNLPTSSTQTQTICANLLPYTWDGLVFTEAGTKTKTGLTNAKGCDSTATFILIVNAVTTATDPSDATRCVGGTSVVFSTTAGGTGPFTYQWSKDGSPIAGATMSSYTVAGPITAAQAGTYSVTVTGACGTDTESATLTVNLPTSSTQTQTICANLLPYTWDGLVFTEAGTKTKTGLTNAKGCDSTATFILIVNAVTTATDPSDATRCVGGTSVVFSTTAGGTGPFTYQWSKDGSPIAGATMSSYTVAGPITAAQAGTYSVTVTGACGTDTESATLTVNLPTSSTQTQTICANLLPYTWDGLVFTEAGTKTKTGLTNAKGCDSTATFILIVNAVTTATDPSDATRCVGGTSVVFSTTAGGTGPFTYQWSKDGSPIAGATMSSYTVAGPITAAQAGTYSVTVTGACGTDTESATLTVNLPTSSTQTQTICANLLPYTWDGLVFTEAGTKTKTGLTNAKGCDSTATFILIVNAVTTATDPSDATRCVGGTSVVFSTTAGGTGPFTYQWSKDGSPIAGATMSSYTVAGPITAAQAGTYSVTVTGACGTDTESATLTVNLPTSSTQTQTICANLLPYTWDGLVFTEAGTKTKTGLTNAKGCDSTATFILIVNAVTTATDPSDATRCVGGTSVVFSTTAGGTGPFTYQWSKDGSPIAGATMSSYTVAGPITAAQAGTYSVTVTGACGTDTESATLTVNPLPIISCSATPTVIDITSAAHNTQLDVSLAGNADTDPTHYSYSWTEDGAGSFNFSNIKNPVYTAGVLDAGQVISFTVTVTNLATGCTSTSNCSVTVNAAGSCPTVPVSEVCNGSTNTYTAGRAPSVNETWKWTVNNGATIMGADNGQSVTVKAGAQNFTLTLTISYANTELSPTVCSYEVTTKVCAPICTYTQGFWGNPNGLELLPSLLTSPIIIGRPGQSVIIPAGSHERLNSIMPGGSTPTGLHAGDCSILDPCFNAYLTSQGKINNNLLSQTIGVALAVRLNGASLSGLAIGSGCIVTSGGSFQINQNVVAYLGASATIQDLLDLANDVLGGVKMPGVNGVPSYSDLNSAMDAINNGFDECRFFVGYCETPDITSTSGEAVRITAYPNPFVEKVNFAIVSPVSGKASLEVYNMFGQKIQTVYEGNLVAGRTQFVEFRPNTNMVAGTLIYKLNVAGKQVTGKVINLKQ